MIYHVWITALISAYESKIIQKLITRNYSVSAASGSSITMTTKDGASALIALKLDKNVSCQEVYDDVVDSLKEIEARFYSIVISEVSPHSMWTASNIVLANIEKDNKTIDKKFN